METRATCALFDDRECVATFDLAETAPIPRRGDFFQLGDTEYLVTDIKHEYPEFEADGDTLTSPGIHIYAQRLADSID